MCGQPGEPVAFDGAVLSSMYISCVITIVDDYPLVAHTVLHVVMANSCMVLGC